MRYQTSVDDEDLLAALNVAYAEERHIPGDLVSREAVAEHCDLSASQVSERLTRLAAEGRIESAMTTDPKRGSVMRGYRPVGGDGS